MEVLSFFLAKFVRSLFFFFLSSVYLLFCEVFSKPYIGIYFHLELNANITFIVLVLKLNTACKILHYSK